MWLCTILTIKEFFLRFNYLTFFPQYWGFELRASYLRGRHSTFWAMLQSFIGVSYFSGRLLNFCLVPASEQSPSYGLPPSWHHSHTPPCLVYWLKWCLTNFLPGLVSNLHPPDLCLPNSWDYICEPLYSTSSLLIYIYFGFGLNLGC
jgi:hypothetical protein